MPVSLISPIDLNALKAVCQTTSLRLERIAEHQPALAVVILADLVHVLDVAEGVARMLP